MKAHRIRAGETLGKLAMASGWPGGRAVYDHPDNQALRDLRDNPNVLAEGDEVILPRPEPKTLSVDPEGRHVLTVTQPKRWLSMKLQQPGGAAYANEAYVLHLGGEARQGTTDGDGVLKESLSWSEREARLEVAGHTYQLALSRLSPMKNTKDAGVKGMQARLLNLGYDVGPVDGELGPRSRVALGLFQSEHDLDVTGALDDDTQAALISAHGA